MKETDTAGDRPSTVKYSCHRFKRGQVILLFAILMPLFFGMLGLGIDCALMYRCKAQLSRAADSVALRMVRQVYNSSSVQSMRETLAVSIMQDNMPGFMQNPGQWSASGDLATGTTETLTLSSTDTYPGGAMQSINITTQSFANTGVMQSTVTVGATYQSFFLPIFSSNFKYVHFTETAQAQRYPSVNILIIDISASMYGNGGASGVMGANGNTGAVQLFINEFDESRDYMMVVTFSSKGAVIWPRTAAFTDTVTTSPTYGMPYFGPSQWFVTGTSTSGGTLMNAVNNYMAYCSVDGAGTNGYDGLHVAVENVQKWLDNTITDPTNRKLTRINYIYMTDGGLNMTRSYVRGPGFGCNLDGTDPTTITASRLSVHNTFHDFAPIVGTYISSTWSWPPSGGQSLTGLFGTYSTAANMPGICADFAPTNVSSNSKWWAPTTPSTQVWTSGTTTSTSGIPSGYTSTFTHLVLDANASNTFNGMVVLDGSTTTLSITTLSTPSILGTEQKMGASGTAGTPEFDRLVLPLQIVTPLQNPARGTDFYLASGGTAPTSTTDGNDTSWTAVGHSTGLTRNGKTYVWLPESYYQNYRMHNYQDATTYQLTDARMDSYPVGAYYAPLAGCPMKEMSLDGSETYGSTYAPTSTRNPYLLFPSNNEGWYSISARLTDYYPDYTLCGVDVAPKNATGTGSIGDPKAYKWWSFQNKSWGTGSTATEAYWLVMAQCYVLRYNDPNNGLNGQNATIYCVKYGTDNSNYDVNLASMANDPSALVNTSGGAMSPTIISGQNQGKFYAVSNSSQSAQVQQLKDAFKEIAARITVRLSK